MGDETAFEIIYGDVGLVLSANDINTLSSNLSSLIALLSGENENELSTTSLYDENKDDIDYIFTILLSALADGEWAEIINDISVSVQNEDDIFALILSLAKYGELEIGVKGGFSLTLGTAYVHIYASVEAGKGAYSCVESSLNEYIEENNVTVLTTQNGDKPAKIIYLFVFGVIDQESFYEILGAEEGDTYAVRLMIDGDKSGIVNMEDVYVDVALYYTEHVAYDDDGETKYAKMIELEGDIRVDSTVINMSVMYFNDYLYVSINKVNGTELGGINAKICADDIYAAVDEVVALFTNSNILSFFTGSSSEADEIALSLSEDDEAKLITTIRSLLTIDFANYFSAKSVKDEDGNVTKYTLFVDVDGLVAAFTDGATTYGMGSIECSYDIISKSISVSFDYNGETWIEGYIGREARHDYTDPADTAGTYIDLAFVVNLVDDAVKFATDDGGDIYTLYTFNGSLKAEFNIVIDAVVEIDDMIVTLGLNDDGFYFSLVGNLQGEKTIGMTVCTASTIGLAYSNGYMTIAKNLGTSSAEYKIMTMEYFEDYLLDSSTSTSPLAWLLGIGSTPWGIIALALDGSGISLDSGLSGVETLYLSSMKNKITSSTDSEDTTMTSFNLSDYITGINVKIDSEDILSYGLNNAAASLGLSDNYYAFDTNGDTMSDLTGGAITELNVALGRSDEQGLCGIYANGYIGGMLSFDLVLDKYDEGVLDMYNCMGTSTQTYVQKDIVESSDSEDTPAMYISCGELDESTYELYSQYATLYINVSGEWVPADGYSEGYTYYYMETYYVKGEDGTYLIATSYDENETYYTINSSTTTTGFAAPDLYGELVKYLAEKDITLDFATDYEAVEGYTRYFGCYTYTLGSDEGTYAYQNAPLSYNLTVVFDDGTAVSTMVKNGSTIYSLIEDNYVYDDAGKMGESHIIGRYVYYYLDGEEKVYIGDEYTFTGDTTLYAEMRYKVQADFIQYTTGELLASETFYEGDTISCYVDGYTFGGIVSVTDSAIAYVEVEGLPQSYYISIEGEQNARTVEIYGYWIVSEVEKDGLIYTFDENSIGSGEFAYYVSGEADDLSSNYGSDYLVIASEINGFPVTGIAEKAFYKTSIQKIIVPDTITYVGGLAFGSSSLTTLIFLSDSVTFDTTGATSSVGSVPEGYAFYGCDESLKVYCANPIPTQTGDDEYIWQVSYTWIFTDKKCTNYSDWYAIKYSVSADDGLDEILPYETALYSTGAADLSAFEDILRDIDSQVNELINEYTLENFGYIYGYNVSVSVENYGRLYVIRINVLADHDNAYYAINISQGYGDIIASGDVIEYNDELYAKLGTDITISLNKDSILDGYMFSNFVVNGVNVEGCDTGDGYTYAFEMMEGGANISAEYSVNIVEISVHSEIDFSYTFNAQLKEFIANTDNVMTAVGNSVLNKDITAINEGEGYSFLGWAMVSGGNTLVLEDNIVVSEGLELYAVWTYTTSSNTVYSYVSGTNEVSVANDESLAFVWYTDKAWENKMDEAYLTGNNAIIDVDNTVLVARGTFTLSFMFEGSNPDLYVNGSSTGSVSEYSISVAEGYTASVTYSYTYYTSGTIFTSKHYYTVCNISVLNDAGETESYVELYMYRENKDRILTPAEYSSNWSNTPTASSISSDALCSEYATEAIVNGYTYISYTF